MWHEDSRRDLALCVTLRDLCVSHCSFLRGFGRATARRALEHGVAESLRIEEEVAHFQRGYLFG